MHIYLWVLAYSTEAMMLFREGVIVSIHKNGVVTVWLLIQSLVIAAI